MSKNTKGKVLETFRSIQGEGKYAGTEQIFVRLFECNMHCIWCDTPHSIGDGQRKYEEYSSEQLFAQVQALGQCQDVSLTGGEPLLQKDFIKEFVPFLKQARMRIHLETNGTLPEALDDLIHEVDVIAMDMKMPSSTKAGSFWKEHEDFLKIALAKDVFVKTVVSSDTLTEDIERTVDIVARVASDVLFILQPNFFEMRNGVMDKCLEFQNYCSKHLSDVRILPQIHKFMKLR